MMASDLGDADAGTAPDFGSAPQPDVEAAAAEGLGAGDPPMPMAATPAAFQPEAHPEGGEMPGAGAAPPAPPAAPAHPGFGSEGW